MNPQNLINECRHAGVIVHVDDGALKLRGKRAAVQVAAERLRPYKAELLEFLATAAANEADICGPYTPYCCPVSPKFVHELHTLVARYAHLYCLSVEATARIIEAAKRQPLAAVPSAVAFFRAAVDENSNHRSDSEMPDERR